MSENVLNQGVDAGRLEAFSDGVLAIIITIMVLEIHHPEDSGELSEFFGHKMVPVLLAYLLSFIFVGNYWNNHHHLLKATKRINGGVMWANLHLLFWLSLIPILTGWLGVNHTASGPAALYGIVGAMCGFSYVILQQTIKRANPDVDPRIFSTTDIKGGISTGLNVLAIGAAFISPWISYALFVAVAIMWFVPSKKLVS